ncbi:chemotaxis-specific protein-glutamate methyltransferase CheB [Nitrospirillum viridazoti]|uniref:Protein-glutamate methylesterase/protein-glutamine glutaminase n=1 Tax=Nitrospirillum viridazoti CBAmc TaxID=1441467 RepID=A0A248JWR2_9PROT|nr:chemotaxis-specific protein-glutamate methyltransferase CheB [Nitrospirillum amazonense]ASG22970.1 chemotaxis response regulator protein-glutamate methylesterase [Nitrospirillum amazonense CBAmc]TWB38679.1 two-component system chemotaxis response regulator CheB [Nitrospirillum amazonense]
MIRVVVAEDSPTLREYLVSILSGEPDIEVVAIAVDGVQAVEAVARHRPDVVTMDIHMPRLGGLAATRRIMEETPCPIVVVSSTMSDHVAATFRALDAGAVAFVHRPVGVGHPRQAIEAAELAQTVRLMAEVKVVRRWANPSKLPREPVARPMPEATLQGGTRPAVVAIGASTGGPVALQAILAGLPADFPIPLLAVQHISPGFVGGFADWLASGSALPVQVAKAGDVPRPGHFYLAPDNAHMGLGADGTIKLDHGAPENSARPAVSHFFRSVTRVHGARAVGVLLSGMGVDGAMELREMRDAGAVTFAQDKESSIVHGMPGAAIALGGATAVLKPGDIAARLLTLARKAEEK